MRCRAAYQVVTRHRNRQQREDRGQGVLGSIRTQYRVRELSTSHWQTFKPLQYLHLWEAPGALKIRNCPILLGLTSVTYRTTESCCVTPAGSILLSLLLFQEEDAQRTAYKLCSPRQMWGDQRTHSPLKFTPLAAYFASPGHPPSKKKGMLRERSWAQALLLCTAKVLPLLSPRALSEHTAGAVWSF